MKYKIKNLEYQTPDNLDDILHNNKNKKISRILSNKKIYWVKIKEEDNLVKNFIGNKIFDSVLSSYVFAQQFIKKFNYISDKVFIATYDTETKLISETSLDKTIIYILKEAKQLNENENEDENDMSDNIADNNDMSKNKVDTRKYTKEEVITYLYENFYNPVGNEIDLSNLDFSKYNCSINISNIKVHGNVSFNNKITNSHIIQDNNKAYGNIILENNKCYQNIYQKDNSGKKVFSNDFNKKNNSNELDR